MPIHSDDSFVNSPKAPFDPTKGAGLSYTQTYLCPICRHGQISGLTLMDALACNFCRHIFTANLAEQTVQVVDSSQPMTWRWTGQHWKAAYQDDANLTWVIWSVGMGLVFLPSILVGLAAYTFPPLPDSPWSWFPTVWVGCTFLVHFLMVFWLLAEHYQFPPYISSKIRLQALFNRRA